MNSIESLQQRVQTLEDHVVHLLPLLEEVRLLKENAEREALDQEMNNLQMMLNAERELRARLQAELNTERELRKSLEQRLAKVQK